MDLAGLPVVDGHAHPLLADPWAVSAEAFLDRFSEGRPGTMREHVRHTVYFQRAVAELARRLETAPDVDVMLARRREHGAALGADAVSAGRLDALLIDTGYPPDAMSLDTMRTVMPCAIHEVFRTETCAERLLGERLAWKDFRERYREALIRAAERCVGLKSIIAYRSGLAVRPWDAAESAAAYRDVLARLERGGSARLTEKPLLDALFAVTLEVCVGTGRPLQVHAGFGDPDIDLVTANPLLLRPIVEDAAYAGLRLVLLHMAWPYHREAAFMTAVWPQVYLDISLALPFLGPAAVPPLVDVLGMAPASKVLYGSDVGGLPELFAMTADWGRESLGEALDWLVARHALPEARARASAALVLSENARRLYAL
jgi:predicted TIM-barrel fold metal-dependent hydrolase